MTLITPGRNELIIENRAPTLRFIRFLEELTREVIGRNVWTGAWVPGRFYNINEEVTNAGALWIANQPTADEPRLTVSEAPDFTLGDTQPFVIQNNASVIESGPLYDFTETVVATEVRVWVGTVTATTTFRLYMVDNTNPLVPVVDVRDLLNPVSNNWTIVSLGNKVIAAGSQFLIFLQTINSSADTTFNFDWGFDGSSQNSAPANTRWNKNNQSSIIRIDNDDNTNTDRSAQLATVIAGSNIRITLNSDPSVFELYLVNDTEGQIGFFQYVVSLLDSSGDISTGDITDILFTVPIPVSAEYAIDTAWMWSTESPPWANISGRLAFDAVLQGGNDEFAFGTDLKATEVFKPDGWDLKASTGASIGVEENQSIRTFFASADSLDLDPTDITYSDFTTQAPASDGIGNQIQIKFGPAMNEMAADGTWTAPAQPRFEQYQFTLTFAPTRTNNGGIAELWVYATKNGVQAGVSVSYQIDRSGDRRAFTITLVENLAAGDEFRLFLYRDTAGFNDGQLTPVVNNDGLNDAPSALLQATRLVSI